MITKIVCFWLFVFFGVINSIHGHELLERKKRYLIFPKGGSRVQVVAGFGVPVDLDLETIIIGSVFKANYQLPTNISDITYNKYVRRKRSFSRWEIYNVIKNAIEMQGLNGTACILKAICEISKTPFAKTHSMFEEILHLILTPSSTNELIKNHDDNQYINAQKIGLSEKNNCNKHFPDCNINLMNRFTITGRNRF